MKNITKLWILSLALAGAFWFLMNTNTQAAETTRVVINTGTEMCNDLPDYDFGTFTVSVDSQTSNVISGDLYCELMDSNAGANINYAISDMAQAWGSATIAKVNIAETSQSITPTWNLGSSVTSNLTDGDTYYDGQQHIPEIWAFTWEIDLQLTIPGNTPAWTYTGTVVIDLVS